MVHNVVLLKVILGFALIIAPEPIVTTLFGVLVLASLNKNAKANVNISEPLN